MISAVQTRNGDFFPIPRPGCFLTLPPPPFLLSLLVCLSQYVFRSTYPAVTRVCPNTATPVFPHCCPLNQNLAGVWTGGGGGAAVSIGASHRGGPDDGSPPQCGVVGCSKPTQGGGTALVMYPPQGGMHWRGEGTPLQGPQPTPSHCLPDAKCEAQWHL